MVEIKARPNIAQMGPVTGASKVDLGSIPEISGADLQAVLSRSGAARSAHAHILKRAEGCRHGGAHLSRADLQGMLERAGVETTDVKTVLAYHVRENRAAFSDDAITFMAGMDWTDVAAAHIDELKRQNQEQVDDHQRFMQTDRREFETQRRDDGQKLKKVSDEKSRLQKKTPLEMEADFADEVTKSGLKPSSKEAFLLLAHRKRFVNTES